MTHFTSARLFLVAVQFALALTAQAQVQNAGTLHYEFSEKIDRSTNISPLGDSLFGDSTNNETGATTFSVTDITAATNVKLPVQLGRTLSVPGASSWSYIKFNPAPEIFGLRWSADVPYIENDSLADFGWAADGGGRCSTGTFSISAKNVNSMVVRAHNFFFGNDINVPGYGRERLLTLLPGAAKPTDGATYVGTTKSNWKISCLPAIKNGSGEGFIVTLPDGAKYYFDWWASEGTGYISTAQGNLNTQQVRLYATKAIDRFGGTVVYTYDTAYPHRIKEIRASDGAVINVTYNPANGKVASASVGTRTWLYTYLVTTAGYPDWDYLSTVTLPDASKWTYSSAPKGVSGYLGGQLCEYIAGTRVSGQSPSANDSSTFQVSHPSGAIGLFTFRAIMFGYNRTPGYCHAGDFIPKAYIGNALYKKAISGPGIVTKNWLIRYYPSWSYAEECTAGCPTTASTVITEDDGTTTTYLFGNNYSTNAAQLLSKTISGAGVSSVEAYEYVATAAGQPFPDAIGIDPHQIVSNPFLLLNRPLRSTTITQSGRAFTRTIEAYDQFVRPTQVKRSSAASP